AAGRRSGTGRSRPGGVRLTPPRHAVGECPHALADGIRGATHRADTPAASTLPCTALAIAAALALAMLGGSTAASATPNGSQFRVDIYTTGYQISPSVASDSAGNFVV